ncbi:MAG: hypothetical protein OEO77_04145 [Acidimicrobiia bacterium]|nr:hypothetical protein [Acidimicrobiia bacterium]
MNTHRAQMYTTALAALWVTLTIFRPTTTFHLAPLLVGVAPVLSGDRRPARAMEGPIIAVATAAILAVSGRLDGPSLLPVGGALLEAVVAAAAATAIALTLVGREHRELSGG